VALTEEAMALGAAGAMISPKPGLVSEDTAVQDYFAVICGRLGPNVPICVQDYPPASGVQISAQGLADMLAALPQLGMVKLEDNPNLAKLTEVLRLFREGPSPRPSLFVGNNALYTELELARGADGIMTGFAFPEMLLEMYRLQRAGDAEEVARLFQIYLPLIRYESQPGVGLAARKYVLMQRGLMGTARLRAPGYDLTAEDRAEIDGMLARLERQG
jgi:4-hydroxy-tetrahydrodipicolinate synthase